MSNATTSVSAGSGHRARLPAFTTHLDGSANLQALFAEVTALANQLRKTAASVHREDDAAAAGLGLLQVLDRQGLQTVPGIARLRGLSRQNVQLQVN